MITSKELRLGNYILGFYEDEDGLEENEDILFEAVCRVTSLDCSGFLDFNIYVESDDCNVEVYEKFEGIDLTEEWLLKFGFKEIVFTQDRNREWFKMFEIEETDELFSLCFYPEKNICYLNFDVGYGNNVLNIEFIHKLQNLYFSLTGSELTVA